MFEPEKKRYLTRGVDETIPPELQLDAMSYAFTIGRECFVKIIADCHTRLSVSYNFDILFLCFLSQNCFIFHYIHLTFPVSNNCIRAFFFCFSCSDLR